MKKNTQLEFAFPSLDFPDRSTLYVFEVAKKLGKSEQHIHNLIDCGELNTLNVGSGKLRRSIVVPVESYRNFIVSRLDNPNESFELLLGNLPTHTLQQLKLEIEKHLNEKK